MGRERERERGRDREKNATHPCTTPLSSELGTSKPVTARFGQSLRITIAWNVEQASAPAVYHSAVERTENQ
jgi:hypothetical protein